MPNVDEYKRILYVPLSVVIASFIVVLLTSSANTDNGVTALTSGYMGMFIGIVILIVLTSINMNIGNWLNLAPFIIILLIIFLLLFYLIKYHDRIANGEVSDYYASFSTMSTIFLATQLMMLFSSLFNVTEDPNKKLIPYKMLALLILFGVINFIIVITMGVILGFYTTQG
jgi:hypothetical protein